MQLHELANICDALILDDWRRGIDAYLFEPETARIHLARARPILAELFSTEAIARQWDAVLTGGRTGLSEPGTYWQPAPQMA